MRKLEVRNGLATLVGAYPTIQLRAVVRAVTSPLREPGRRPAVDSPRYSWRPGKAMVVIISKLCHPEFSEGSSQSLTSREKHQTTLRHAQGDSGGGPGRRPAVDSPHYSWRPGKAMVVIISKLCHPEFSEGSSQSLTSREKHQTTLRHAQGDSEGEPGRRPAVDSPHYSRREGRRDPD